MTAQKLRELAKRTQPFLLIAALLVLAGQAQTASVIVSWALPTPARQAASTRTPRANRA
jgi:hypothetical protein